MDQDHTFIFATACCHNCFSDASDTRCRLQRTTAQPGGDGTGASARTGPGQRGKDRTRHLGHGRRSGATPATADADAGAKRARGQGAVGAVPLSEADLPGLDA